jgi:hypothetical protein
MQQVIQTLSGKGHTTLFEGESTDEAAEKAFYKEVNLGKTPFDTTEKGEGAKVMNPPNYDPTAREITFIPRMAGG